MAAPTSLAFVAHLSNCRRFTNFRLEAALTFGVPL